MCTGENRYIYQIGLMPLRQRLLICLFGYNVMPNASSNNEVRPFNGYFIWKMTDGLGDLQRIPLAMVIMQEMLVVVKSRRAKKSLCFPLVLTEVFRDKSVDFTYEDKAYTGKSDMLNGSTLSHMGMKKINGL